MNARVDEIRRLQQMRQQKAREIRDLDARIRALDQAAPEPRTEWDGLVYGQIPELEQR